jgi:hypothetical protein
VALMFFTERVSSGECGQVPGAKDLKPWRKAARLD